MALTFVPAEPNQGTAHNGVTRHFHIVNNGIDHLKVEYVEDFLGEADATQIQQREAIKTVIDYAFKDAAFLTALNDVAQGVGVTTPASLVAELVTKLTA